MAGKEEEKGPKCPEPLASFLVGSVVEHPRLGTGIIKILNPQNEQGKPITVEYTDGKVRHYSLSSAKNKLRATEHSKALAAFPIGSVVMHPSRGSGIIKIIDPQNEQGKPITVEFTNGQVHHYSLCSALKLRGIECPQVLAAFPVGAVVVHPSRGTGIIRQVEFENEQYGKPITVEFDGEVHHYSLCSALKLRVANNARSARQLRLLQVLAAFPVGSVVEHPRRGAGIIKPIELENEQGKPIAVEYANGEVHHYSISSALKLHVAVKGRSGGQLRLMRRGMRQREAAGMEGIEALAHKHGAVPHSLDPETPTAENAHSNGSVSVASSAAAEPGRPQHAELALSISSTTAVVCDGVAQSEVPRSLGTNQLIGLDWIVLIGKARAALDRPEESLTFATEQRAEFMPDQPEHAPARQSAPHEKNVHDLAECASSNPTAATAEGRPRGFWV
jgi:hypothetical protein